MDYKVRINSETYDLPPYSIKIAGQLEEIELLNGGNQKFRYKCEKMYDFVSEMIGKQAAISELGKFEEVDPNVLNIAYLEIVKSYNKPLTDYNAEKMEEAMGSIAIEKAMKIIENAPKIAEMKNK